jgi:hypothetical protein
MRVTCNEDDFSENSRCILEGWLTYIDLKHAIPFAQCSRFGMAGMWTSGLLKPSQYAVTVERVQSSWNVMAHGDAR